MFSRVEDIRKGRGTNAHEVYFNVTGQEATGDNSDNSPKLAELKSASRKATY
ncbi:hypothetical protein [Solitalea longa]|uniref:hypothetical protein n=1 Tax=Solitalea longa TaxID=2079460 RepID=UPI0013FD17AD|nr:hypothetical protein [Solitalea longa]